MAKSNLPHLTLTTPILVITEGVTDLELIIKIFELNLQIINRDSFQFHAAGSYEKALKTLEFVSSSDQGRITKIIGLIVDADDAPTQRVLDLGSLVNTENYPFVLRYHIVPGAQTAGAIESLALLTLDENTLACSEAFVACVESTAPLNAAQRDKLKLYAWTSQQEKEPVTNFMRVKSQGQRAVDVNHAAFDPIVAFLTQLANHVS
jgi:hypothetical protein